MVRNLSTVTREKTRTMVKKRIVITAPVSAKVRSVVPDMVLKRRVFDLSPSMVIDEFQMTGF
jgi:hypothetical protein